MKLRPSGDVSGQGALRPVRIGNGSLWRLMIVSRPNQLRRRNRELVRPNHSGVGGGAGAVVGIWSTPTSRYPVSVRLIVHKIGEYPGPSQHLRPSAVVVDCSFFVHATHNCGYYNKRQGPEMSEPMERQNRPLVACFFPQNQTPPERNRFTGPFSRSSSPPLLGTAEAVS